MALNKVFINVTLPKARASHPHLDLPWAAPASNNDPVYSCDFIFPPSADLQELRDAMNETLIGALGKQWSEDYTMCAENRRAIQESKNPSCDLSALIEVFGPCTRVRAKVEEDDEQPAVYNQAAKPVTELSEIKRLIGGGDHVIGIVKPYAWTYGKTCGVSLELIAVQLAAVDRIGGVKPSNSSVAASAFQPQAGSDVGDDGADNPDSYNDNDDDDMPF